MQRAQHHTHPDTYHLLRASDLYMPGHGMGVHTGHDKHAGNTVAMFRVAFWFCLVFTIPTLLWDPGLQEWVGYRMPDFSGASLIPALFGTAVIYYGGQVFIRGAYSELRNHQPGMMVLISMAISVMFIYSAMITIGYPGHALWWELAALVTILLLGDWVEMIFITRTQGTLRDQFNILPDVALRIGADDQVREVLLRDLRAGDRLLIRPDTSIPVDGVVISGKSMVNESMITGEPNLVNKDEGDEVIAGAMNGENALQIRVVNTGDNTALAGIIRFVEEMQNSRSRVQESADKFAYLLTVTAVAAALVTLLVWLVMGASLEFSITRMVTVLVMASPQAMGLAVPLVIAVGASMGASKGLLIRERRGLEESRKIDIVVFGRADTLIQRKRLATSAIIADVAAQPEQLLSATDAELSKHHALIRPESYEAIKRLHDQGIRIAMLTDEPQDIADRYAKELGIDMVFSQLSLGELVDRVCRLQDHGRRIAIVGDGSSDAPALVMADIGIAIGAGTGAEVDAGDVALVRSDPRDVARIINLSRAIHHKIVENLWWAAGYNIVAIPLAAGMLAGAGILLTPATGAALMAISTVLVAANALLLKRVKL